MDTHDRQRHRGQHRILRRAGVGVRVELAGRWYEGRRRAHAWLCRHCIPFRWMALNDAALENWLQWVKRQEKYRQQNDYLCWKAARADAQRKRRKAATKRQQIS